jgi:Phage capsid family
MCPDTWDEDFEGEAPPGERPFGTRPFGTRPFGTRPFGTRPFGTRPFGTRPFGTRPFGTRPFGTRPFGTRPFGTRPFGTRPFGTRPFGTRDDEDGGDGLDPAEWSADIAELFCAMSATVRLGARIVYDVDDLLIPARQVRAIYLEPPEAMSTRQSLLDADSEEDAPDAAPRANAMRRARIPAGQRSLRPREHELSVQVAVRNSLIRAVAQHLEVADALKRDIARALAVKADAAFLHGGDGPPAPEGITQFGDPVDTSADTAFGLAREILRQFRVDQPKRFENPGWVFDPATLEELTRTAAAGDVPDAEDVAVEVDTKTLDATRLLQLDGLDGGVLLGYPFVVTRAATQEGKGRIYFSSDWGEAWIGAGRDLVCVDFSAEADFTTDTTIVKAVMHHDFVVRRPSLFTYTEAR